ncbi:MAG: hypothetical protein RTU30_03510 [Candidatus Thorarchaeota archaeon]
MVNRRSMMRKKILLAIVTITIFFMCFQPVSAVTTKYDADSITEAYGGYREADEYAYEIKDGGVWMCRIFFIFEDVATDADDYWVHIDYDGMDPGYPWSMEALIVHFKWAPSGWTYLTTFELSIIEDDFDLTSATTSTLVLSFRGAYDVTDPSYKQEWYFGAEPTLHAYWD